MDLAPNDPDGVYARRFVRAWATSFGRPTPVTAKLVHNLYLRAAASEEPMVTLEKLCPDGSWRVPRFDDGRPAYTYPDEAAAEDFLKLYPGRFRTAPWRDAGSSATSVLLTAPILQLTSAPKFVALPPPRVPWYRRLFGWLRGKR